MKKIFFIATILILFITTFAHAEKVIVVYKPDKSVEIITPAMKSKRAGESMMDFLIRAYEDSPSKGLPYDIMDASDLPDSNEYIQESWEGEKGEGIIVNTIKAAQIEKERAKKELIYNEIELLAENEAIESLKQKGILDEDGDVIE